MKTPSRRLKSIQNLVLRGYFSARQQGVVSEQGAHSGGNGDGAALRFSGLRSAVVAPQWSLCCGRAAAVEMPPCTELAAAEKEKQRCTADSSRRAVRAAALLLLRKFKKQAEREQH